MGGVKTPPQRGKHRKDDEPTRKGRLIVVILQVVYWLGKLLDDWSD